MTLAELRIYRLALREKLQQLERIHATCEHCEHFAHAPRCGKFDAVPPEEFRRTPEACEAWTYDEVPF